MHVRAQEWVVSCHCTQIHSHFLAEVLKDPRDYLLEAGSLSALTQSSTIVSPNVQPNLKPGDDDCLGEVVPVSPSMLQNRSCFGVAAVNYPAEAIESLCDGCVDVSPDVLWQEVLVLCQVSRQVALPRVKVAVESSVGDHGRGNVGVRAWRHRNHMGRPRVTQVTPGLRWGLVSAGGGWTKPTSCHAQWLKQLLSHQLLKGLVCSNLKHGAGNSEPTDGVHELARFNRYGVLQDSLRKVETGWPVVKTWLPASLVEDVIHHAVVLVDNNTEVRSSASMADKGLQG